MKKIKHASLEFDPELNDIGGGKTLSRGLSVALQIGDTLWLANDEAVTLERLTLFPNQKTGDYLGVNHCQFQLSDFLQLPVPAASEHKSPEEVDLEGLAYDNGYLWLIGSHSLKRKKVNPDDKTDESKQRLATVSREGNRYLLARIPVIENNGLFGLAVKSKLDGIPRRAAQIKGNACGNELTKAIKHDPHLGAFLSIPGKDNGFDIEGLAVKGQTLFIGLRGPVLRGWSTILQIETTDNGKHLKDIGPKHRPYRKHFLNLDGLGIRDLSIQGSDLLILAGPTMNLDGPVAVFRWIGGAEVEQESIVTGASLRRILEVPYGHGEDHPEGISLFSPQNSESCSLLVVYDSASAKRRKQPNTLLADIFELPAA